MAQANASGDRMQDGNDEIGWKAVQIGRRAEIQTAMFGHRRVSRVSCSRRLTLRNGADGFSSGGVHSGRAAARPCRSPVQAEASRRAPVGATVGVTRPRRIGNGVKAGLHPSSMKPGRRGWMEAVPSTSEEGTDCLEMSRFVSGSSVLRVSPCKGDHALDPCFCAIPPTRPGPRAEILIVREGWAAEGCAQVRSRQLHRSRRSHKISSESQ